MSRQSEAKKKQNYVAKPLSRRCRVCKHLVLSETQNEYGGLIEKFRCGIGDFKVTANGVCDLFYMITD